MLVTKNNYSTLIKEGYPHKQALAICYSLARKNIHKCDSDRRESIRRGELFSKKPQYKL